MKKGLYILLAILLLIVGCDTKTAIKTGEICVNVDGRSIDPISMETSYYSISVTSGNNVQRAPRVEEGSSPARFNVEAGEWTVVVDAYNDHGDRIGTGSANVTVVGGGSTTCNVTVNEISGTGTLVLNLNISASDNNVNLTKMLLVIVKDEKGNTKELCRGPFSTSYIDSPIRASLENGRYFLEIYDETYISKELITAPIPVRIVSSAVTIINSEYNYSEGVWTYIAKETESFRESSDYRIVLESEEVPIDCDLKAKLECDLEYGSSFCRWYLNDYEVGWSQELSLNLNNYIDQCGLMPGETYMLSVKVTDGDPGIHSENSVNTIYYDYKLIKILEEVGLPERIEIRGLPVNADGSIPVISSDSSLYLNSFAVYNNEIGSSISGDWYIDNVLVAENTDTLSLTNLNNYVGTNDVEFKYSINGYTKTCFGRFYVRPEMEFEISLNDLKAGKRADISVEKISGNYDGDYNLQFYFYKNDSLDPCSVIYYSNQNVDGYYPTEPGDYEVKYKAYYNEIGFVNEEQDLGNVTVEEPDKLLDSLYGDNIIQGGMAEFRLNYPYNGSVIWSLDGVELKYHNSNYFTLYRVEWETGPHTIKAVDGNGVEYSYAFNVLPEKESIKFDLEVINRGNYKYEIKVVPVDAVSEDFNYTSTVYVNYNQKVFSLTNNETAIVDKEFDDYGRDSFDYKVVTSYSKAGKDFTVAKDGYYRSDYYSSNEVSFDKFLYVGNENIIVDIKLEEGYKPDQYQYLFYLDGAPIDIDFEGDGEYLLPEVKEGMHQFRMEILWNSGDPNASYTTIFMHSEKGYAPIKANEVYLSCGSDSLFKENEDGTKTYDYFGVKCSSLVLSDDGYCYFCIIKANDASDPVIQTIPCMYQVDKETGNYIFTFPDKKQIVYTKVENRLKQVEYNSLLPYSFVKYQIDSEGQNKIYGNWRFITPYFTQDMLNSIIQKYLPGYPISFDETKGETLNLKLNLSVTGEWINAYLDLSADFTGYDMSLAEGTTIHLEGKIEYEEEDGYLSFMGSRYPIYLQVSEDGTVLLLHVAIPGSPEGTPFIVVPFTRVSSFYNPIVNISRSFNEPKRITIDGVKKALELLCEKQFVSTMLSGMMLQEVRIDSENVIEPGKYTVTFAEGGNISEVLGKELLVVNGNLCFISENSMTILKESEMNEGLNFQSYDNYGVSYYSITKSGDATYNVSYEKQGMPYRKGTITLVKNEVEGIAVVQEFIGKYMEINDGNNPNDIYIEFDNNGDIYYKYGDEFLYMVAHYGINNEKIVIYADAADIADIMGEEVDGWGVKAGIVLPYDGEKDQITLIDDVFVQLYNVPVL